MLVKSEASPRADRVPIVKHPLGKLPLEVGQVLHTAVSVHPSMDAAALHSALVRTSRKPLPSQVCPFVITRYHIVIGG